MNSSWPNIVIFDIQCETVPRKFNEYRCGSKLGWQRGNEATRLNKEGASISSVSSIVAADFGHVQRALRLLLWLVLILLKRLSASSSQSSWIGRGLISVQFWDGSFSGEIWNWIFYLVKILWIQNLFLGEIYISIIEIFYLVKIFLNRKWFGRFQVNL